MKNKLVVILYYKADVVAVCSSMDKARSLAKKFVIDLDYKIDKFHFEITPLV